MDWSTHKPEGVSRPLAGPSPSGGQPRKRGVRLTDLDRDRLWVIGHTGRRWETLGPIDQVLNDLAAGHAPDAGASDAVGSTAPERSPESPS